MLEVSGKAMAQASSKFDISVVERPACAASRWRGLFPSAPVKVKDGSNDRSTLRLFNEHMEAMTQSSAPSLIVCSCERPVWEMLKLMRNSKTKGK